MSFRDILSVLYGLFDLLPRIDLLKHYILESVLTTSGLASTLRAHLKCLMELFCLLGVML